jgi:hypothetical protein
MSTRRTTGHWADVVDGISSERHSRKLIEVVAGFLSPSYLDLNSGSKILKTHHDPPKTSSEIINTCTIQIKISLLSYHGELIRRPASNNIST